MKDFIKFFSIITGLFRSVVTILFILAIFFVTLVDADLLVAFFDILGFTNISRAIIKPILITVLILLFVLNFIITRHIFKAGDNGNYHLSNLIWALLFLAVDVFVFIFFIRRLETPFMYAFFILNGVLAINSLIGLIAKSRGVYDIPIVIEESNEAIIEDEDINAQKIEIEPVALNFENNKDKNTEITEISEKEIVSEDNEIEKSRATDIENDEIDKKISSKKVRLAKKRVISDKKSIPKKSDKDKEDKKPVLIDKSTTNKVSYQNSNLKDNETYDDDYVDDIKKEKEDRIFDKNEFIIEETEEKDED